ncbi:MAG: TatD family hydrolase, partial [Dehalococcoidia bacterium]|nr:TatD family hydrolase [Dehalococcoidia bacterium]
MTAELFDTHAHLTDPKIAADLEAVLARAWSAGVTSMVVIGYDLPSSEEAVRLAGQHPGRLHPAVGLHPHEA